MATIRMYHAAQWCATVLPTDWAYWLADRLADAHRLTYSGDAQIVRDNLRAVLGQESPHLETATREVFRHFGRYVVDFLRRRRIDQTFVKHHVDVQGQRHLDAALADGRGAMVLTAHLGHWELAGMVTQALGYALSAVALRHEDPEVDAFFVRQRTIQGVEVIPMGQATRRCLTTLRQRRLLGLLCDRDFSQHAAISVEMFGKPTWIPRGPAVLSLKTGRPVVPGFLVRLQRDRFRLAFEPPIDPPTHAGHDEAAVLALTRQYVAVMERYIRAYPNQWLIFEPFWQQGADKTRERYRRLTGVVA